MDPLTALFWGGTALKTVSSFMPKTTKAYSQTVYNDGTKYGGYRGAGHGTISESRTMHVKEDTDLAKGMNTVGEAASLIGGIGMASTGVKGATAATPQAEGGFSLWQGIGQGMGAVAVKQSIGPQDNSYFGAPPNKRPNYTPWKIQNQPQGYQATSTTYQTAEEQKKLYGRMEAIGRRELGDNFHPNMAGIAYAIGDLESRGYESQLARQGNNLYAITAGRNWQGGYIDTMDKDENGKPIPQRFRAYANQDESIADFYRSIVNDKRYKDVNWQGKPEEIASALYNAGYAASPTWANSVVQKYNSKVRPLTTR